MRELSTAGRRPEGTDDGVDYAEHLRTPDLSLGTYVIGVGDSDPQEPHTEDEVYVVTAGRGVLVGAESRIEVGAGSVVFVPALEPHRFEDIAEELVVVVIFGPAEYSRCEPPEFN